MFHRIVLRYNKNIVINTNKYEITFKRNILAAQTFVLRFKR